MDQSPESRQVEAELAAAIVAKSTDTIGNHPGLLVDYVVIAAYEIPDMPGYTRYFYSGPFDQRHHQLIGLLEHGIQLVRDTMQEPGDDDD